ncbi:MAG: hypothetical protein C4576_26860 [Desulfobacteraceae bacterium]|nr:MAG: hypothetical protein C4576_26860 [Desulfobacteraceae bacterium]
MKFKKVFHLLIETFAKEKIDYALIGAFALNAYGYVRATRDVDFIVRSRDQGRIVAFLESLGFETIYRSSGYSNHVHQLPGLGRIDFVYVMGETAEQIFQNARELPVLGDLKLPVASLEHIVALKVFAMKNAPERALREMADIQHLIRHSGLDPRAVRRYFDKYDQMERYFEITGKKPGDNES